MTPVTRPDRSLERLFFELHSHIRDTDGLHADAALDEVCKVLRARLPGCEGAAEEPIQLSAAALARVEGCLAGHALADSAPAARGRAFQRLLAPAARAGMGQYFTPEPVVRFMVDVLRPLRDERVLDPFCGAAAFLARSVETAPGVRVHGIEKSHRMARIARTGMRLRGVAEAAIRCADALLGFDAYDDLRPGSFDVVLTNPPFGSVLDARSIERLGAFDLAPEGRSVPLEVLGLERSIRFLRPGGRLGIVLPDGVLSNASSRAVREWLAERVVVEALVGLPVETFRPFGASVRTSVLIATRRDPDTRVRRDHDVCLVRVGSVGYDAAGRALPTDDLDAVAAGLRAFLDGEPTPHTRIPFTRLVTRGRWQVDYFAAAPDAARRLRYPSVPLGELVADRREMVSPSDAPDEEVVYVGLEHVARDTGDLVAFAPRRGRDVRSRSKTFRAGDVLYGRLRPYLNKVFLPYGPALEGACSGEFHVLTPDAARIHPRFLREMLASPLVIDFATRCQSGAALPRVPLADLLSLPIPLPPPDVQARIVKRLRAADAERRALRERLARIPAETSDWLAGELG